MRRPLPEVPSRTEASCCGRLLLVLFEVESVAGYPAFGTNRIPSERNPPDMTCSRCEKNGEPLEKPPFRGTLGETILARVCRQCWADWQAEQTKLINENRLSMGDPRAQAVLDSRMKEFLRIG